MAATAFSGSRFFATGLSCSIICLTRKGAERTSSGMVAASGRFFQYFFAMCPLHDGGIEARRD